MVTARHTLGLVACAFSFAAIAQAGPGNILVGNRPGHNVLEFDASNGDFLKTFVQLGETADVTDMAWGPDGDLYVTDMADACVHRYDGKTREYKGQFVTSGSGGLASPQSLVFGPDGNLYVTGTPEPQINEYNGTTGEFIKSIFKSGQTVPGQITFGPDGLIYFVCQTCMNVKVVDPDTGKIVKILLQPDDKGLPPGHIRGLAWGPDGNVYVTRADDNDCVARYNSMTGAYMGVFAVGGMDTPYDVTIGADVMYVSSIGTNNVMAFDAATGAMIGEAAASGVGGLAGASGVLEVPADNCYPDFTGDGVLDLFDFLSFMNDFNSNGHSADCDHDDDRDLFDFLCFVNAFNAGCP